MDMTLHDAWSLIAEACYAYKNKKARHAFQPLEPTGKSRRLS
jgi:hypothetical protein